MTQSPTPAPPSPFTNPRQKRFLRMAAAAVISAALAQLLSGGIGFDENKLSFELATAMQQLFSFSGAVREHTSVDWPSAFFMFSLSVIAAFGAGTACYALKDVVRAFAAFQICLLAIVTAGLLHLFLPIAVKPAMLVLSVIFGTIFGWLLKMLEERRRKIEAQLVELKLREKELLESRMTLVKQDETERRLLAADLHDQVLNDLKALKTKIDKFGKTADSELPGQILSGVDSSMVEIRNIMDALSPVVLEHFGLASAAEECLERGGQRAGFMIDFDNQVDAKVLKGLSQVEQQLLYRLIQESITNTCKHSKAKRVSISIESEPAQLLIRIKDDGTGIAPSAMADSRGLRYMRLRAGLIGAAVAWLSPDPMSGKGTVVEIRHPLAPVKL
jgi:signal transduction histidine kinase